MILSKKHKIIIATTAAAIFLLLSVIISNYHLEIIKNSFTQDDSVECRIVLISDLHGNSLGKGNKKLLKKITELQPDIICLAGDFIDEDNTPDDNAEFITFLNNITDISPVIIPMEIMISDTSIQTVILFLLK